jgi:hypothetical protein
MNEQMKFKSNSWNLLFLRRQERAARVKARRQGTYHSVVWGWK